ncbi:MAG: murein transglycosylase A [Burkholderiaceae bacterium]
MLAWQAGCTALPLGETLWVSAGPRPLATLPGWRQASPLPLAAALRQQCAARHGKPAAIANNHRQACSRLTSDLGAGALRAMLEREYVAWPVVADDGNGVGLLTGYHEPLVTGSRRRRSANQEPLYQPPPLTPGIPGPSRAQIAADPVAAGVAGRELVWLDDPVEAFFLQIQGSGRIRLRDGSIMRVGYAAHNGHAYHAIGRTLIDQGALRRDQLSADAIKRWLREHPQRALAVMQTNPRVIFFRELAQADASSGPIGALGLPLTARGSAAVDLDRLPGGALLYGRSLDAPQTRPGLVLAQDRGSAIRGAVRVDWFTGSDEPAARLASSLDDRLRLWLLWPRGAQPPGRLPVAWPEPPL